MSRNDFYLRHVKEALLSAGWTITDDPLVLRLFGLRLKVDVGASRTAADGSVSLIAVEVKNFRERKDYTNEFQKALGQYLTYFEIIKLRELPHVLYLAVPDEVHETFFQNGLIKHLTTLHNINFITFDPDSQTIVQWKPRLNSAK